LKFLFTVIVRAALIALAFSIVGLGANLIPSRHIPWIYSPAQEIIVSGQKLPVISTEDASKSINDPLNIFIDTREEKDYMKGHVAGAFSLPPDEKEIRFPGLEPMITSDARLIVYCYGPECDMAEKVAAFLLDLGYPNLAIMQEGYLEWEKKGFPIERSDRRKRSN
jgi:rhodanese-related sulfurtransferase